MLELEFMLQLRIQQIWIVHFMMFSESDIDIFTKNM